MAGVFRRARPEQQRRGGELHPALPAARAGKAAVVVIAAHPPKQAGDDNLLPYGGGATLNEVDGNFTLPLDDNGLYRFSWLGKIRGLPFDPLYFRIDRMNSPEVVTVEGDRVLMPVMFPIADEDVEARQEAFAGRDLALLKVMSDDPGGAGRQWAATLGWSRRAVSATLDHLKRDRLVEKKARRWRLTKAGERMANEAGTPPKESGPTPGQEPGQAVGPKAGQEAF